MITSSAPARVCLYGEHQDYLHLKVIPSAINLRLTFRAKKNDKREFTIRSINLNQITSFPLSLTNILNNSSFSSYLEAGYLSLKNKFPELSFTPLDVELSSDIPIESGLSSSAALLVAWIKMLACSSSLDLSSREIAELAYIAEHDILNIPCGRMDQYSSAVGSIISLDLKGINEVKVKVLNQVDAGIVVVNSKIAKKTNNVHSNIVSKVKHAVNSLYEIYSVPINEITSEQLEKSKNLIKNSHYTILKAVISIRDDTELAEKELIKNSPDLDLLGSLLTSQQTALREGIGVSLPILDKIVNRGIKYGALGGKLTGAGLGGCVVLLTRSDEKQNIATKLKEDLALPVFAVEVDEGVRYFEE